MFLSSKIKLNFDRYHIEVIRAEWCYSLVDACQRLAHEEEVSIGKLVLRSYKKIFGKNFFYVGLGR